MQPCLDLQSTQNDCCHPKRKGLLAPPSYPLRHPEKPSNRDHKALNRGTLGGLGVVNHLEYLGGLGRPLVLPILRSCKAVGILPNGVQILKRSCTPCLDGSRYLRPVLAGYSCARIPHKSYEHDSQNWDWDPIVKSLVCLEVYQVTAMNSLPACKATLPKVERLSFATSGNHKL